MRLLSVLVLLLTVQVVPALAIGMCGSGKRVTCVVDGDTIWLRGEKIRLQGFDATCSSQRLHNQIQWKGLKPNVDFTG